MRGLRGIADSRFGRRYLGNREFYRVVLALVVPIVIQNTITNFVSLLDNIMVGAVSTEQMSGVSIANQLVFVYNLCIFGGMSVSSIFAAQYYGAKDEQGIRYSFRYAMYVALVVGAAAIFVLGFFRGGLISRFINDVEATGGADETFQAADGYVLVMIFGLLPFAVSQAYAGILRVVGESKLPMIASVTSVLVNLLFNYLLIFGKCGFPAMQAKGAAVATVISRYVEMLIIVLVSHRRLRRAGMYGFLRGAYRSLRIPGALLRQIFAKGLPLLANEALWSSGMTCLNQQYSLRGLNVVAALTVTTTITNLFNTFYLSMGTAASVMVGRALGAGDEEESRACARKIIFFDLLLCLAIELIMFVSAPALPRIYLETGDAVRGIARDMIRVYALAAPLIGFANCAYFILRAGGRTGITFLFDCGFTWVVPLPVVAALVHFTDLGIIPIYAVYHATDFVKDVLGYILLKKGIWIQNIVSALKQESENETAELN